MGGSGGGVVVLVVVVVVELGRSSGIILPRDGIRIIFIIVRVHDGVIYIYIYIYIYGWMDGWMWNVFQIALWGSC